MSDADVAGTVDVLVDDAMRLGALSYRVPDDLVVHAGDAVAVPFGKGRRHGLVLGASAHPERATRAIERVWGKRASADDLDLLRELSAYYFCDLSALATRLSPREGRGAEPLDAGDVALVGPPVVLPEATRRRRYLLAGPVDDLSAIAASEVVRLAERDARDQILVLCPTREMVDVVLAHFGGGAARLDAQGPAGAWRGFAEGTVRVGVGTRSAALYSAERLGAIVLLDDAHPGHRERRHPTTHARDVAISRANATGCRLSIVGDNPTAPSLGAQLVLQVVGDAPWPTMRLFPRGEQGRGVVAPAPLLSLVAAARRRGVLPTVVMGANATTTRVCVGCGTKRPCTTCAATSCRHSATSPCSACGETKVRRVGWDATRVGEVFGDVSTVTLGELDDLHDAGLVVLFNLDGLVEAPGTPGELCTSVVLRCARAAGRRGTVAAVSSLQDPLLHLLFANPSSDALARRTWRVAKEHGLAPFGHTVALWVGREARPNVRGWPGRVYGPRRVGSEWEIVVQITNEELGDLAPWLAKLRRGGKVRLRLD